MKKTNVAKLGAMNVCSAGVGINIISAFVNAFNNRLTTTEKVISVIGHVTGACICENARRIIRDSVINDTIPELNKENN